MPTWDGSKLVMKYEPKEGDSIGKPQTHTRELDGEELILVWSCEGSSRHICVLVSDADIATPYGAKQIAPTSCYFGPTYDLHTVVTVIPSRLVIKILTTLSRLTALCSG